MFKGFTFKQVAAVEIVLGDKKHENETFYYDLAYLNSDFSQNGIKLNFFKLKKFKKKIFLIK